MDRATPLESSATGLGSGAEAPSPSGGKEKPPASAGPFEGRDSGWTQFGDGGSAGDREINDPNENGARAIAERLSSLTAG